MSILIKGMEMPTTCGNCWFCHAISNKKWHCRLTGESFASYSVGWGSENNTGENGQHPYIRRDDCPLVPVPKHGRCIDADALKAEGWELQMFRHDEYGCSITCRSLDSEDIPTILEAEEGET